MGICFFAMSVGLEPQVRVRGARGTLPVADEAVTEPALEIVPTTEEVTDETCPPEPELTKEPVSDAQQTSETVPNTTGSSGSSATNTGNTGNSNTSTTGGLPAGLPKPTINNVLMFRKSLCCHHRKYVLQYRKLRPCKSPAGYQKGEIL